MFELKPGYFSIELNYEMIKKSFVFSINKVYSVENINIFLSVLKVELESEMNTTFHLDKPFAHLENC